jgi:ABC-type Fe3+-siderophore transport system permease subunit
VNDQYEPDLAISFYGYITPVLAIITVLFNSFIFYVLSKKYMRSPTNLILFSIALCDTVTILSPLTWYLHTYAADGYQPSQAHIGHSPIRPDCIESIQVLTGH